MSISRPANRPPPLAARKPNPRLCFKEAESACGAMVETESVAVMLLLLLMVTDVVEPDVGEVNPQVISAEGFVGVRAQERFTVPVKPFCGLTVMVERPVPPGVGMLIAVGVGREQFGAVLNPGQDVTRMLASIEPSPVTRS